MLVGFEFETDIWQFSSHEVNFTLCQFWAKLFARQNVGRNHSRLKSGDRQLCNSCIWYVVQGADARAYGGILQETALMWAARSGYMAIINDLLQVRRIFVCPLTWHTPCLVASRTCSVAHWRSGGSGSTLCLSMENHGVLIIADRALQDE